MPRYMLDADTCSHVMKPSNDALLKRLRETPVSSVSKCLRGGSRMRRPSTHFFAMSRFWTCPTKQHLIMPRFVPN